MIQRSLFVLILLVGLTAQPAMAMDLTQGVFDIAWGTDVRTLDGFKRLKSTSILDFYTAANRTDFYSDTKVQDAIFAFADHRLYAVFLTPATMEDYNILVDSVIEDFGNPNVSKGDEAKSYQWPKKTIKIAMMRHITKNIRRMALYNRTLTPEHTQDRYEKNANHAVKFSLTGEDPTKIKAPKIISF